MHALLDTHALLWWFSDDPALTKPVRKLIADTRNDILVSAATAWEISIKAARGRLPAAVELLADFGSYLERERFQSLEISCEHAIRAGLLPANHRDPFDRMLIAQAQAENLPIVSNEAVFDTYGVRRLW